MSEDRKIRCAVVGLSARSPFGRAKPVVEQPNTELVAVCDVLEAPAREVGEEYEIPWYTDYEQMLAQDDIEMVFIATPDALHAPQTIAALESGIHVLCEKPMAISMDEVHAMLAAEEKSGCKLGINQVLRTNPRIVEAKRLADSGYFGELFYGEADYVHNISSLIRSGWRGDKEQGHTPFVGGGCHMIDLLRWCMGEVVEIHAYGSKKCLTDDEYPFVDCAISTLKFESGACGKFGVTYGCQRPSFRNFMLYGTEATYLSGRDCDRIRINDHLDDIIKVELPVKGHPYGPVIRGFAQAVIDDTAPPISGRDVANTIAIALAGDESIATGRPVKPERFAF
ncbi:MAG: Gfo/Idh/MocA family oxidoreductase [candidate division WS1 bacterium]|nr:Gfo/Idh/MocA family oxidoreductase [candidate division WS1 bacterium]